MLEMGSRIRKIVCIQSNLGGVGMNCNTYIERHWSIAELTAIWNDVHFPKPRKLSDYIDSYLDLYDPDYEDNDGEYRCDQIVPWYE